MRKLLIIIAALSVSLTACKSQKSKSNEESVNSQADNTLTLLMSDLYGGSSNEEIKVIKSRKELDKYFIQINKTRKPGLKPPDIDFEKYVVVGYSPGRCLQFDEGQLKIYESNEDSITLAKGESGPDTKKENETTAVLEPFELYSLQRTQNSSYFPINKSLLTDLNYCDYPK